MQLAQESVLMQYGYSVSQEEGLTSAARRKILALIVDHKILTRNEIIGYLDFFINQRKNQPRFEKAIDKWAQDREFISEYRAGEYIQYGVNGLFRKRFNRLHEPGRDKSIHSALTEKVIKKHFLFCFLAILRS